MATVTRRTSPTSAWRNWTAYYRMCRKQSDSKFLLIPSEEANVILGGHWSIAFPKPVYWFMSKATEGPLQRPHPKYGIGLSRWIGG